MFGELLRKDKEIYVINYSWQGSRAVALGATDNYFLHHEQIFTTVLKDTEVISNGIWLPFSGPMSIVAVEPNSDNQVVSEILLRHDFYQQGSSKH